jgi:hypothetical protein
VTLGVHCFWDGEAALGGADGVCRTRAVYAGTGEAVEVTYDPARQNPAALARLAGARILDRGANTPAPDSDQKRHLRHSSLRFVPLTAALAAGADAAHWLSPRQRALAARIALLLARDPHALDDLAPPERTDQFGPYQRTLEQRLTARLRG